CDSALLVSSTLPRPPRPTLSPLHDALPILNKGLADRLREEHRKTKSAAAQAKREQSALVAVPRAPRVPPGPRPTRSAAPAVAAADRKSTRLNSSHVKISYAVFCLKKKNNTD